MQRTATREGGSCPTTCDTFPSQAFQNSHKINLKACFTSLACDRVSGDSWQGNSSGATAQDLSWIGFPRLSSMAATWLTIWGINKDRRCSLQRAHQR